MACAVENAFDKQYHTLCEKVCCVLCVKCSAYCVLGVCYITHLSAIFRFYVKQAMRGDFGKGSRGLKGNTTIAINMANFCNHVPLHTCTHKHIHTSTIAHLLFPHLAQRSHNLHIQPGPPLHILQQLGLRGHCMAGCPSSWDAILKHGWGGDGHEHTHQLIAALLGCLICVYVCMHTYLCVPDCLYGYEIA